MKGLSHQSSGLNRKKTKFPAEKMFWQGQFMSVPNNPAATVGLRVSSETVH